MMEIPVMDLALIGQDVRNRILARSTLQIKDLEPKIRPIVDDVRRHGDRALIDYTAKLDGVHLEASKMVVSKEEMDGAYQVAGTGLVEAIKVAIRNIKRFHERQRMPERWFQRIDDGIVIGIQASSISPVGIYVPSGKGSFPSVVPMLAIPAKIAGVDEIVICTPPLANGLADPGTVVAADLVGIRAIYKVGGPQAIAAMAYGTETVRKVNKIVGPGGAYVSAAKRLVSDDVAVGTPAGPSETFILADESADPTFVAVEALCEAEHGDDSSSVVVVQSREQALRVKASLQEFMKKLPDRRRAFAEGAIGNHGGIFIAKDIASAIDFANECAPEHLVIMTRDPFEALKRVKNAGAVFLGPYSSVGAASYATGSNSVLPTGGTARAYSATSVMDFVKFTIVELTTKAGLAKIREAVAAYADYEKFPAHKLAVEVRLQSQS